VTFKEKEHINKLRKILQAVPSSLLLGGARGGVYLTNMKRE
jgi:hypothetical protein